MIYRGWAFLACRLLALVFGFVLITLFLDATFGIFSFRQFNAVAIFRLSMFVVHAAIVFFLWFGAAWLSTKLIPNDTPDPKTVNLDVDRILTLGISILGLVLIVSAVPSLIANVLMLFSAKTIALTLLIKLLCKIAIGFILIFKASGIAGLLKKNA